MGVGAVVGDGVAGSVDGVCVVVVVTVVGGCGVGVVVVGVGGVGGGGGGGGNRLFSAFGNKSVRSFRSAAWSSPAIVATAVPR